MTRPALLRLGGLAGIVATAILAGATIATLGSNLSPGLFLAALVLICLLVLWVSSTQRLFWLLAAAVATTPFSTFRALGDVGNVSDTLFLAVLLALLVRSWTAPQVARTLFALGAARGIPLALIAAGGILASMNAVTAVGSLLVLAKIVFTFWMIPNIFAAVTESHERLRSLVWAFLVGASLASLGAMSDMLLGTNFDAMASQGMEVNSGGRFAGPTGHPNLLGLVAAIGVSGAVGLYLVGTRRGALALVAAGICSIGIVLSASLTAMAAVVGGVAVALFMAGRRAALRRGAILLGVFLATMFLIGKVASEDGQILLLSRLEGDVFGQESVDERDTINSWAIAEIKENPYTGYGLDQVGTGPTHDINHPIIHNLWIQTWYTAGLLGLVGFALLYLFTWRMRKASPRSLLVPFMAMTVPWVASMISQPDVYARWGLFGVLGIIASYVLATTQPHEVREPAPPPPAVPRLVPSEP